MARKTNNKIRKQHLILCEGRDAEEFLIAYLNSDSLSNIPSFSNDFQVMDFGGNENLSNYIELLKNMEGFEQVKTILIIRDAERNSTNSIKQIQSTLQKSALPVPETTYCWQGDTLKIGFLLFPTCNSTVQVVTLEDLCLSILKEHNSQIIIQEIMDFMKTLENNYNRTFPHEFKTKLHSYFSITDDFVSMKIGEAARAQAFDWNHENLIPLKNFLMEVIN